MLVLMVTTKGPVRWTLPLVHGPYANRSPTPAPALHSATQPLNLSSSPALIARATASSSSRWAAAGAGSVRYGAGDQPRRASEMA